MTKQRLPKPAVIALVVAGLLVAGALGYFVMISPKRSDAARLTTEIQSVETEIQTRRIAQTQQQAPASQPIRAADLFRVTKAMPNKADMPGVLLELNRIARETGIRFESITPQEGADAGGYLRQPIDLVFEGNFYELSDFLYRLRTLVSVHGGQLRATGRLFTVRSLNFVEGAQGFPQIKATLGVDAYVYGTGAAESAPAPGAAPAPAPAPAQPAPAPAPAGGQPAPAPAPAPAGQPAPTAAPAPNTTATGAG